jgi:glycosyltransferase involved in cell wall biosynthesis
VGGVSRARTARYARAGARWTRLLATRRPATGLRVSYGWDTLPAEGEPVAGGTAKLQKLAARFPNRPADFTLLYLASPHFARDLRPLLWVARRRGAPVVVNQNGVAYPGWAGERTDDLNRPLRRALAAADHILYQSAFCKRSADEFLGEPGGDWEILPNAVDVDHFTPARTPTSDGPVLLLGGDQTQAYRLELALATLRVLLVEHPGARMIVTGRLVAPARPMVERLRLTGRVEFAGRYAQRDAPAVIRRAQVMLHTKVNDPCPTSVIEAMACGLPVVYPASGGTVELVGEEAGIGVAHPDGWERDEPPGAEALADAVVSVLSERAGYAAAARRRAVQRFSLEPWLDRHAELFGGLAARER